MVAESVDKVQHEPEELDHSEDKLVFSVIVSPGGQVYELPAPLQASRDKAEVIKTNANLVDIVVSPTSSLCYRSLKINECEFDLEKINLN